MRPAVLLELARRNGIELPAQDEAGLKRWFRFTDFEHFVQVYLACSRALRPPGGLPAPGARLPRPSRRTRTSSTPRSTSRSRPTSPTAPTATRCSRPWPRRSRKGERRYGVTLRLIPDIVRNVGVEAADRTLEWALAGRKRGVVAALGLSGSERLGIPNEPFREHFAAAQREGLHRVAHAGEHAGPESIRSVLDVCAAERIGHGVRAVEDPALVEELRAAQIPLEVCPTSNVCLGVGPGPAEPSLRPALPGGPGALGQLGRSGLLQHQSHPRVPAPAPDLRLLPRRAGRPLAGRPPPVLPAGGRARGPGGELPPAVRRPGPGAVRRAGRAAGELSPQSLGSAQSSSPHRPGEMDEMLEAAGGSRGAPPAELLAEAEVVRPLKPDPVRRLGDLALPGERRELRPPPAPTSPGPPRRSTSPRRDEPPEPLEDGEPASPEK